MTKRGGKLLQSSGLAMMFVLGLAGASMAKDAIRLCSVDDRSGAAADTGNERAAPRMTMLC